MKKILAILICFFMIFTIAGCSESKEMKAAKKDYETEKTRIEKQEKELKSLIKKSQKRVKSNDKLLDESLMPKLETKISDSKVAIKKIPEQPGNEKEIKKVTKKMKKIDYTETINQLNGSLTDVENSVKQYKLVDNPSEEYVIQCLRTVDGIVDVSAATEDNDPNGKLHKDGGYTSQVYFSYNEVNQDEVSGTSVIDKGTDCGGSIEVYKTPEEAESRLEYLKGFDSGMFASGSHVVKGTVLVRTSNLMTATQQKQLEEKIIQALTKI